MRILLLTLWLTLRPCISESLIILDKVLGSIDDHIVLLSEIGSENACEIMNFVLNRKSQIPSNPKFNEFVKEVLIDWAKRHNFAVPSTAQIRSVTSIFQVSKDKILSEIKPEEVFKEALRYLKTEDFPPSQNHSIELLLFDFETEEELGEFNRRPWTQKIAMNHENLGILKETDLEQTVWRSVGTTLPGTCSEPLLNSEGKVTLLCVKTRSRKFTFNEIPEEARAAAQVVIGLVKIYQNLNYHCEALAKDFGFRRLD